MGIPPLKHGWMAALLAAFVALFVLTSAVDAAACTTEPTVEAALEAPVDTDSGEVPDDHAICSHGHCHHGGAIVFVGSELSPAVSSGEPRVLLPSEPLASRTPAGPERPPRD
jgi:hypothetical protein